MDFGLAELPAPKARQSSLGPEPASKPAPRSALASAMDDLPAPKPAGGGPLQSLDLDDLLGGADLPAPKSSGVADLPTPKSRGAAAPPPPAAQPPGISDLPAPKARPPTGANPVRPPPQSAGPIDLPAPKGGISDLPAPKPGGFGDLPMPKPGGGKQPVQAKNLDLDLPAPKGGIDLPAPKGFFDDLPQPAQSGSRGVAERAEVPAPKGFFDDLPGKVSSNKPDKPEVPAPKGFFDDLPQPSRNKPGDDIAPKGFFEDLPQPGRTRPGDSKQAFGAGALPLEIGDDDAPIELAEQPSSSSGLGPPGGNTFDELDLSTPSVGEQAGRVQPPPGSIDEPSVVKFGSPRASTQSGRASGPAPAVPEKQPLPSLGRAPNVAGDGTLELEEPKAGVGAQKLQPKRPREEKVNEAAQKAARAKRSKIVLGTLLGLSLAGAGGYFFYQRHAKAQARVEEIDTSLNVARKSLVADDANHWTRAAGAANKVIELDEHNPAALGIAAEASIAGAYADGKQQAARFGRGRKLISDALSSGVTGPELDRAQALSTLTTNPGQAIPKFQGLLAKNPKDGMLSLYLGWAQSGAGSYADAIKSFDQAMAAAPSLKALALDGRARAKLAQADVEGARNDFNEVLKIQKDNIAAQVGIASTLPQSQAQQQEADLLAILQRKDIKDADPRAVVAAYVLAADDALRSRRLDAARERYRQALAVDPKDISAMTGLAETEMRDRKLEVANEQIAKALTISKDDVRAQLVAAEIEIQLGKLDTAAQRLEILSAKKPPLATLDQVKLQIASGKLLDAQNKDDAAVEAYAAAAKLAGDFDLTPMMAAVTKLNEMAHKAQEAGNPAKEHEYRERATALLSALDDKAQTDPQLAMTLGVAYLTTGDPDKAEPYLRRVVEARPTDADALYQYGKALGLLQKFPEAIEQLKKARELAPDRAEIGLELAITYERTKNDDEAGILYDKLVESDSASIETRAHAGKFYVRTGQIPKAGQQGSKIVKSDPEHAAGHYLKGEGLLAQNRAEEARKEFSEAVRLERDPLYLDGQGRATEAIALERNDTALEDQALRAYLAATELDPNRFTSLLGAGRVYVHRREHAKAVGPLLGANQIKKEDAEVGYLLGLSYQALGNKKTAIQWLEFALRRKPIADAAYQLGELYTDPDVDRGGPAQVAYRRAVSLWEADEKAGKTMSPEIEKRRTEALYKLGNVAGLNHDESTQKWAWERWVVRPGANKNQVQYNDVRRALATSLKTVGPPPPEPAPEKPAP
jgi:tetratricopeptide (TPR) repeat protein